MRTKTQITPEILKQVEDLAAAGLNNIQISRSLNISRQTLSTNKELKDSIQRGKLALSQIITETVLETIAISPATQQLLIKRLCLFNPVIDIVRPTNAEQALNNLGTATKLYANGEINESQLKTIEAVSNSFIKGTDVIHLEERITALEESINA